MLFDLFKYGLSLQTFVNLATRIFIIFAILPFHEFAHALIATKLGDNTAKMNGRLTLNPLAHIDPIGALMIFVAGFGYAKPVPVNPFNFKEKKKGMALTALAGPVSNIVLAFISIFFMYFFRIFLKGTIGEVVSLFLYYNAILNTNLAVFNLLPIPPLDGSRLIAVVLPDKIYFKLAMYERYIIIVVFVLLLMGLLTAPLVFMSSGLIRLMERSMSFIFSFGK